MPAVAGGEQGNDGEADVGRVPAAAAADKQQMPAGPGQDDECACDRLLQAPVLQESPQLQIGLWKGPTADGESWTNFLEKSPLPALNSSPTGLLVRSSCH